MNAAEFWTERKKLGTTFRRNKLLFKIVESAWKLVYINHVLCGFYI